MLKKFPMVIAAAAALTGSAYAVNGAIVETTPNDGDLHLIYAPTTGNLTVAINGTTGYGVIQLASTTPVFVAGAFNTTPEFYEGDTGLDFGFGVLTGLQTADVTLPAVLLTGLSEATLLSSITVLSDSNPAGVTPAQVSFSGGLASVPEPMSLSLLGLGGLSMLARRRTV